MFGSMVGALIRFAAQVVQSVQQQFTQQLNVVGEEVLNPLQGILQLVTGGAWRGVGADAFVQEVSSLTIPGIGIVGDQIRTFQSNLQRASDIMIQADEQANQTVQSLGDVFDKIFAG
ncbi:MAG TPA: hypothetical protein VGL99_21220 [Chloroflexota bacterium]|jgi:hypothetical protein